MYVCTYVCSWIAVTIAVVLCSYTHIWWCMLVCNSSSAHSCLSHSHCLLPPTQIADIMHSLFKTHGAQLLPFFDELVPDFTAMVVSGVCVCADNTYVLVLPVWITSL